MRIYPLCVGPKPTIADARRLARKGNPDAQGLTVTWVERPHLVEYPTGRSGWLARVKVEADGYRTREMLLTAGDGYRRLS